MIKRRCCFFGLFVLSLISISFYGGSISYGFFFGVLLVPVISVVYLIYVFLKFRIYQEISSRMVICGQPASYYFVLQNEDYTAFINVGVRLFADFSQVEEVPDGKEYTLLPGDKYKYETSLLCKYRGEYEVGVKEIVLSDFFGLFHLTYKVPSPIKAVAAPRVAQLSELAGIPEIMAALQSNKREETEFEGSVRDYIQGDSLKRIHWKASAREHNLKVRQMTGEEKQGIVILVDTKRYSKDRKKYLPLENRILEIFLALGYFLSSRSMKFISGLHQNEAEIIRTEGLKDFDSLYQKTNAVVFNENSSFLSLIRKVGERGIFFESQVVFMVSGEINAEIMAEAELLEKSGKMVALYVVTEENISDYVKMSSVRKKILPVSPESKVEEVL